PDLRAEPKGERKPMRSREERRQQNIPQGSCQQRAAVKPRGYVGAPSSSPAQVAPSSREDHNDLLDRMLERENLLLAYKRVVRNGGRSEERRGGKESRGRGARYH